MKTSSAKNKARILQQWVVKLLSKKYEFELLEKGDIRSTPMGVTGEDIQLSPAAREVIPFQIECKSKAEFSGYKFLEQAETHGNHTPIAIIKGNRKEPVVVMYAKDFFDFI